MKAEDLLRRRKQKALLNLDILNKRYHIKRQHLMLPLLIIIVFLLNRKYFVFGLLTLLSGIFSFYHDKKNRSPIDFKLPLVLGIIITRYYGLGFTVVFFILSDIIPGLLGGGRIEGTTIPFYAWYVMVNAIVLFFPSVDIITLGIILVLVETLGSIVIQGFFGIPGIVALFSSALSVLTRIVYFMTIGSLLVAVFNII